MKETAIPICGSYLTHDDVLSKLLPDVPRYTSDLSTFEIKDYTVRGLAPDDFLHHEAKCRIAKPGDYDPEGSPFVRNIMIAIDTFTPPSAEAATA